MKVKSFIKFLLDHFNEDDNIELAQAYGDCSFRKLEPDEEDTSFIWLINKRKPEDALYYHGETIDKQYK